MVFVQRSDSNRIDASDATGLTKFPCKTHYDPKEAVYTKQALDMWKELEEKGFTFGEEKEIS